MEINKVIEIEIKSERAILIVLKRPTNAGYHFARYIIHLNNIVIDDIEITIENFVVLSASS